MQQPVFKQRRQFLRGCSAVSAGLVSTIVIPRWANALQSMPLGSGKLHIISDGNLTVPRSLFFPDSIDTVEIDTLLEKFGLDTEVLTPDCNVTVWEQEDRLILFDVGAGPNFMPTTGKLLENLDTTGIDPADITDVVFTHAHPDHLWGLLDDFDELICPNAAYHMSATEWDYWRDPATFDKTPDDRKAFVAGAQNRFPVIEDRIALFKAGQEILPGVEAIDTSGHTPGHTSFTLHSGSERIMLIGDAITNVAVSFSRPKWPINSDQDPVKGRDTRVRLLDRLAHEQTPVVGYHLPHPGLGRVERSGDHFRFDSE